MQSSSVYEALEALKLALREVYLVEQPSGSASDVTSLKSSILRHYQHAAGLLAQV